MNSVEFTFLMHRGQSYKSDLAIDDILLRPGECQEIPQPPKMPVSKQDLKRQFEAKATWEPLGTTQKYSWTSAPPKLQYATPGFVRFPEVCIMCGLTDRKSTLDNKNFVNKIV